ncbi:uncharacterized protein LOC129950729 [Eupeodes corollae]|uniref:uncharacterized protein LOC129950729 n=1 Tax=Eupeodes corollae TaxID=290404 RepID=UPI00248F6ED3|nr:uncharacterized protein LOC129950729 [Eupeodes corollae]
MYGNRYKGLSPDKPLSSPPVHSPPPKRTKQIMSQEEFPELPQSNSKNPKFILISSIDDKKPLSSVSVFVLKKAIDAISKEYDSINQLRDGNILILAKNKRIAEKFIAISNLANQCPVKVKYHDNLNSCKGIVFAPFLTNVPESEIISEMSSQGVTDVYKFTRKIDGKQIPTGLMLFTFDLYQPPTTVEIGFYKEKVKEYIPNPMRCRKCQILGHTTKRCSKDEVCAICNLPPHENAPESCTRVMCANCPPTADPHPSSSVKCPKYIKNKDILTIKTRNKCSMSEAQRLYKITNTNTTHTNANTYTEIAKVGNNSSSDNASSREKSNTNTNKTAKPSLNDKTQKPKYNFSNTSASSSLSNLSNASTYFSLSNLSKTLDNQTAFTQQTNTSQQKTVQTHLTQTSSQKQQNKTETTQSSSSISSTQSKHNELETMDVSTDVVASPISSITHSLLEQKKYFIPPSVNDDEKEPDL